MERIWVINFLEIKTIKTIEKQVIKAHLHTQEVKVASIRQEVVLLVQVQIKNQVFSKKQHLQKPQHQLEKVQIILALQEAQAEVGEYETPKCKTSHQ